MYILALQVTGTIHPRSPRKKQSFWPNLQGSLCEQTCIQMCAAAVRRAGTHWSNCYSCPDLTCLAVYSTGNCKPAGQALTILLMSTVHTVQIDYEF